MKFNENELVVVFKKDWTEFDECWIIFPVLGRVAKTAKSDSGGLYAVSLSEAASFVKTFEEKDIMSLQEYVSWIMGHIEKFIAKSPWESWMLEAFSDSIEDIMAWKQERENTYWRPCILLNSERCGGPERDGMLSVADSGLSLNDRDNLLNAVLDFHPENDLVMASEVEFLLY